MEKTESGLRADIEQGRKASETIGRQVDKVQNELATLRREFDLQQKLESQRNKRRVEQLEIALLAAGRNPAERDDEAEAELPDFREWPRHAQ